MSQDTAFELAKLARFKILESNNGKYKSIWAGEEDITLQVRLLIEAATAEANKRNDALESDKKIYAECNAELKANNLKIIDSFMHKIAELQAHINTLREYLLALGREASKLGVNVTICGKNFEEYLADAPAESLQAHDDLRKLCEKIYADLKHGTVSRDTMELLREALKEVK